MCIDIAGMHDHVSYALAKRGYSVGKYVPYGPIQDVIPYLLRRAQENRSVLGQRRPMDDRALLMNEIKLRLLGGDDGQDAAEAYRSQVE